MTSREALRLQVWRRPGRTLGGVPRTPPQGTSRPDAALVDVERGALVAVSRATATASARHIEFMAPRGSGLRVPLGAANRAALNVEEVDLERRASRALLP